MNRRLPAAALVGAARVRPPDPRARRRRHRDPARTSHCRGDSPASTTPS